MKKEVCTIDAKNKSLGRLSAKVASLLQGKDSPSYAKNKEGDNLVIVKNVSKMRITGKKMNDKKYYHHSGFMGGLKETPMKKVFEKDPGEVLKIAVYGMLPKNKLRSKQIKRLKIDD